MMSEEKKRDYDEEVRKVLGIYERHKALIVPVGKTGMWGEEGVVTSLQWVSSEGKKVGKKDANA